MSGSPRFSLSLSLFLSLYPIYALPSLFLSLPRLCLLAGFSKLVEKWFKLGQTDYNGEAAVAKAATEAELSFYVGWIASRD